MPRCTDRQRDELGRFTRMASPARAKPSAASPGKKPWAEWPSRSGWPSTSDWSSNEWPSRSGWPSKPDWSSWADWPSTDDWHSKMPSMPSAEAMKQDFGWGPLGVWAKYMNSWGQYPSLTKFLTAAIVGFLGNLICQTVVEGDGAMNFFSSVLNTVLGWFGLGEDANLDWPRLGIFTLVFGLVVGLIPPIWYNFLNRLIPKRNLTGGFMRMLADQFFFQVLLNMLFGLAIKSLMAMEPTPPSEEDIWSVQTIGWAIWIPASLLILLLPTSLQLLCYDIVLLGWAVFLSSVNKE